jgi:molybdopterin-guanine dinucleotide biosynthesis protein A
MADAVLLLAGGAATRFPGKLECMVNGKPLMLHVFDNLHSGGWPMYVAAAKPFPAAIAPALAAMPIYDAQPLRGPLWALLDASAHIDAERIFAVAADQPHLEATALRRLAAAWQPGDEAVVPQHAGGIEPLAALYASHALRRAAKVLSAERRAMRDLLALLRVRYETMDPRYFTNVNTSDDLQRANAIA